MEEGNSGAGEAGSGGDDSASNPVEAHRTRRKAWVRFPFTILLGGLLVVSVVLWWRSAGFSERHLFYFGDRSVEVFSASSLVRLSFADGRIGTDTRYRGYRQRNARGKMTIRPAWPGFRASPALWEVTFGYWHLVVVFGMGTGVALLLEARRVR